MLQQDMLNILEFKYQFVKYCRFSCKVQAIQTSSEICFSAIFLHHLIEFELLITKNYFMALVNASFRSKNAK